LLGPSEHEKSEELAEYFAGAINDTSIQTGERKQPHSGAKVCFAHHFGQGALFLNAPVERKTEKAADECFVTHFCAVTISKFIKLN
jgi:hypothetical protein